MSKSTGNFLTLTDAVNKFSADGNKLNLLFTLWFHIYMYIFVAALIISNTCNLTFMKITMYKCTCTTFACILFYSWNLYGYI